MDQSSALETLAENRGDLNGRFVHRVEPIETRLHEALHRTGYGYVLALLGVTKELLKEERIAAARSTQRSANAVFAAPSASAT